MGWFSNIWHGAENVAKSVGNFAQEKFHEITSFITDDHEPTVSAPRDTVTLSSGSRSAPASTVTHSSTPQERERVNRTQTAILSRIKPETLDNQPELKKILQDQLVSASSLLRTLRTSTGIRLTGMEKILNGEQLSSEDMEEMMEETNDMFNKLNGTNTELKDFSPFTVMTKLASGEKLDTDQLFSSIETACGPDAKNNKIFQSMKKIVDDIKNKNGAVSGQDIFAMLDDAIPPEARNTPEYAMIQKSFTTMDFADGDDLMSKINGLITGIPDAAGFKNSPAYTQMLPTLSKVMNNKGQLETGDTKQILEMLSGLDGMGNFAPALEKVIDHPESGTDFLKTFTGMSNGQFADVTGLINSMIEGNGSPAPEGTHEITVNPGGVNFSLPASAPSSVTPPSTPVTTRSAAAPTATTSPSDTSTTTNTSDDVYTVQSDDNLWSIVSNHYGLSRNDSRIPGIINNIASLNDIADPSRIYAGQNIKLPPLEGTSPSAPASAPETTTPASSTTSTGSSSYVVLKGDSLWGIAASRYGLSISDNRINDIVNQIAQVNGILSPDRIYEGTMLTLPAVGDLLPR